MRYFLIMLIMVVLAASAVNCRRAKEADGHEKDVEPFEIVQKPHLEEPLLLNDEPLLLDDEPLFLDKEPVYGDFFGENTRCYVCHVNYQQEAIAAEHARVGIGCKDCHGVSDEHIADESWASGGPGTAPDRMFPLETINPFCMTCHTKDKIDVPQHATVFAKGEDQKVCTDCHGKHRLHTRRCTWK